MKRLISLLVIVFMLCACDNKTNDFTLTYQNITFTLGEEFSEEKYGEAIDYAETESCAFEGLDKTYKYEHYEITTSPIDKQDKITSIYFLDSDIKTNEGIQIGDDISDMEKVYGKDYTHENSLYTYTKNKTKLTFLVQDTTIISIEYLLDTD